MGLSSSQNICYLGQTWRAKAGKTIIKNVIFVGVGWHTGADERGLILDTLYCLRDVNAEAVRFLYKFSVHSFRAVAGASTIEENCARPVSARNCNYHCDTRREGFVKQAQTQLRRHVPAENSSSKDGLEQANSWLTPGATAIAVRDTCEEIAQKMTECKRGWILSVHRRWLEFRLFGTSRYLFTRADSGRPTSYKLIDKHKCYSCVLHTPINIAFLFPASTRLLVR